MEEKERVLAKAEVRFKISKAFIITAAVYLAIVTLVFILCSESYHYRDYEFCMFGQECFGVYRNGLIWVDWVWTPIFFLPYVLIIFPAPLYAFLIMRSQSNKTELTVTDTQVFGSYGDFLTKKQLQMPIEKVDNLVVISGFWDKIRSGETLGICSGSGVIKLHFVQNAKEIVAAAMTQIEANRGKEASADAEKQAPSATEKLKELMNMKEMGLITEEEFAAKRQEILSGM